MATVIINEKTAKGKKLLEFLKVFAGENFINIEREPNAETKKAIEDAKKGKVVKTKNISDLMTKLKS